MNFELRDDVSAGKMVIAGLNLPARGEFPLQIFLLITD